MSVILVLHRYLGVLVGLVMTLWCVSGFVTTYQAMPSLTDAERLAGLPSLSPEDCCALDAIPAPDEARVSGFRVEMVGERPVLLLASGGPERIYDLRTGESVGEI